MNWLFTLFFCVLLVGIRIIPSTAQADPGRFRFDHITVDEGLAHSDALALVQDREGFIWVGTNKGLNRYDGYELKKYTLPMNSFTGLPSNRIRAFHVSRDSSLWVGAERAGLFLLNTATDKFVSIRTFLTLPNHQSLLELLAQASVNSIDSDQLGRLWIGTQEFGIFMLQFTPQKQISTVNRVQLPNSTAKQSYPIRRLVIDQGGTLWVGTIGGGLWSIDGVNAAEKNVLGQ